MQEWEEERNKLQEELQNVEDRTEETLNQMYEEHDFLEDKLRGL